MRVAVTGASGFTGRFLVPELEARQHQVAAITCDITDPKALRTQLAALAPDAVIHLAGLAFVDVSDFSGFYRVNQIGAFNLLEALGQLASSGEIPKRPRAILASTAQVYGAQASGLIDEGRALAPPNHYALSKMAMELGSRFWDQQIDIMVVRPFNYTGVGQEVRYLVPKIVDHFRRRAPKIELGNIDVRRDFGDVRSVVEAYARLLTATEIPVVCNFATGRLHSVRELVAKLSALTGHEIEIEINPAFVRANDVPELGGDNTRLRQALPGWRPRAIEETLEWMVRSPASPR